MYMNQFGKPHGLSPADGLIASAARKNALKLWKLNRKHYPMPEADDFWKPGK
ncbi:MAG: hypothetical protein IMF13_04905 [Proteobacteria bacterium]|nr:hypothetical protein [Pseudomonadota bacterium]